MHGHTTIALVVGANKGTLYVFDAAGFNQKAKNVSVITDLESIVNPSEVYKILAFKDQVGSEESDMTVVLIENQIQSQVKDRLTVGTITKDAEGKLQIKVVKQIEVPKTYSACISAKMHHSGYSTEGTNDFA